MKRMNGRFSCVTVLLSCVLIGPLSTPAAAQKRAPAKKTAKAAAKKPVRPVVDDQALRTQVMLARAGFSPGEIDGRGGSSTRKALEAFTKNGGAADGAIEPLVTYKITAEDADGPFTPDQPTDMM